MGISYLLRFGLLREATAKKSKISEKLEKKYDIRARMDKYEPYMVIYSTRINEKMAAKFVLCLLRT